MKILSTLIAVIGLSFFSAAQPKYSKVKILTDSDGLAQLASLGVAVDHGISKKNTFFISDFSDYEISIMEANGFNYEILIDDVKAYYAEHSNDPYVSPKNVNCNSTTGGNGFNPPVPVNHFENNETREAWFQGLRSVSTRPAIMGQLTPAVRRPSRW